MKNQHHFSALTFALVLLSLTLPANLFAASTIFSTPAQLVINAIDFDDSGDLFYLQTDFDFGAATPESTVLIKRTKATGYTDPDVIFDFSAKKFGSFVTTTSDRVYFGENSDGTIQSVKLDGSDLMSHGTVPFNFDLAISPGGDAFVSVNPGGFVQTNEIVRLDLTTGMTTTVVDTTNDFSGPVEFDTLGNLYYGGTGSPFAIGAPTDIYQFTSAEIATALATTPINLSAETSFFSTSGNSNFEFAPGIGLYRHAFGGLTLVDTVAETETPVIGEPAAGFGPIAHNGSSLYGISTDFSANTSAFVLIPEPSRALLSMIALFAVLFTRRNVFTQSR